MTSRHVEIALDLISEVRSGRWRPGEKLPPVRDLMRTYGASNATVQRALTVLRAQAVVQSRPRSGTVVTDPAGAGDQPGLHPSVIGRLRDVEARSRIEVLAAGRAPAPVHVQELFELAPGGQVVMRQRRVVRSAGGAVELATVWLPDAVALWAADVTQVTPLSRSLAEILLEGGVLAVRAQVRVQARSPRPGEDQLLHAASLPPATATDPAASTTRTGVLVGAVLAQRVVFFDSAGRVVAVDDVVFPPDRWMLGLSLELSGGPS